MKLRSLRLHHMGPFRDVALDLDAVDATVVAVTGRNGEGKTSLLELGFAGPLYRTTPTQGTLAARATSRDSFVEAAVGDFVIRQCVDSQTGAGEAMVRAAGGGVLVESGKVRAFDAWAAGALPPADLFFSSVFGAQGSAGFVGLGTTERKKVLLRALGIEKLEALAERARLRRDEAQANAKSLATLIDQERAGAVSIDAATAAMGSAARDLEVAQAEEADARAALDAAKATAAEHALAESAARAHRTRMEDLFARRRAHFAAWEATEDRCGSLTTEVGRRPALAAVAALTEERRARLADLERATKAAEDHAARERELLAELTDVRDRMADHRARLATSKKVLDGAASLREEAARVEPLRASLAAVEGEVQERTAAAAIADREAGGEARLARAALDRQTVAARRMQAATERLIAGAGAVEAEEALPRLREEAAAARAAQVAADEEIERLRTLRVRGKDLRIEFLRGGLETIVRDARSRSAADLGSDADWTLQKDAGVADEQAAAPEALERAKAAIDAIDAAAVAAEHALRSAEMLAARRSELEAARADKAAAYEDHASAVVDHRRHEERAEEHRRAADEARTAAAARAADAKKLREQLAAAESAARRLPEIAAAEATIGAIETQIADAGARIASVEDRIALLGPRPERPSERAIVEAADALAASEAAGRDLVKVAQAEATLRELEAKLDAEAAAIEEIDRQISALGPSPSLPPAVDLAAAENRVGVAIDATRAALRAHARAEAGVAAARQATEKVASLEVSLRTAEDELAAWTLLSRALGRDGIQALLIDAAGPELTGLVNDLLRACFGSRYTVTIATTRAKKSGDGDREVCDVLVYDAQTGREGEASTLSGGQRVIVGEAIALALSAVSCRRAGLREVTLVRDETGAALDEENARAYVAMLRRAAQIIGASKVLFVSHNPETWGLADARLVVGGGKVEVEGGETAQDAAIESRAAA